MITTLILNRMNILSLNPEDNKKMMIERDSFSSFHQHSTKDNQIRQGMSPGEISDVVSDHLMAVVKEQFENAKKQFQVKAK